MEIWRQLYERAKGLYHPEEVTPFLYTHHVVCALESMDGRIYTGFCMEGTCGSIHLCAERMAAIRMYMESGQISIKRMLTFRETPYANGCMMPCGVCCEFLLQLSPKNKDIEIMVDYETKESIPLESLMPHWWGWERYHTTCKGEE